MLSPEFTRQLLLTPSREDAKGEKALAPKSMVIATKKSKEIRADIIATIAILLTNISDFFN